MLNNIGLKIKEAREEQNVSQKDLGMALGLTDKAISAYEACRTVPPLETLVRIADELHKPLDYFIHNETNTFRMESQLSKIENILTQFLFEITEMRKQLSEPSSVMKDESEDPSVDSSAEFAEPTDQLDDSAENITAGSEEDPVE